MTENTQTVVEVKTTETNPEEVIKVRYPLFVVFAEYLGFVSPLIDWAETLCFGTLIPKYQQEILRIDALSLFDKIKNEWDMKELRELYKDYYEIFLNEFDKKLNTLEMSSKDDLPF